MCYGEKKKEKIKSIVFLPSQPSHLQELDRERT